jgi:glc operon protein GlcG
MHSLNIGTMPARQRILPEMRGKMMKRMFSVRMAVVSALAVAAFAFGNTNLWAQGSMAAPFNKVTVSDDVAKRTLMKAVINADTARAIVDACVEWQKAQPGNVSVVVFVLSPTGEIVDSHAMDGVLPIGAETGLMKAKTALYARSSSASVAQRFKDVDGRLIRLDLGREEGLSYYFVSGGLPIVVDNQLIGAVGVGGGNADEQCAYQALTKVLGPQPPLAQGTAPAGGGEGQQRQRPPQ